MGRVEYHHVSTTHVSVVYVRVSVVIDTQEKQLEDQYVEEGVLLDVQSMTGSFRTSSGLPCPQCWLHWVLYSLVNGYFGFVTHSSTRGFVLV